MTRHKLSCAFSYIMILTQLALCRLLDGMSMLHLGCPREPREGAAQAPPRAASAGPLAGGGQRVGVRPQPAGPGTRWESQGRVAPLAARLGSLVV